MERKSPAIEAEAEDDFAGVDAVSPEQIERLVDLGRVGVCLYDGFGVWVVAVPCAVDVVSWRGESEDTGELKMCRYMAQNGLIPTYS